MRKDRERRKPGFGLRRVQKTHHPMHNRVRPEREPELFGADSFFFGLSGSKRGNCSRLSRAGTNLAQARVLGLVRPARLIWNPRRTRLK